MMSPVKHVKSGESELIIFTTDTVYARSPLWCKSLKWTKRCEGLPLPMRNRRIFSQVGSSYFASAAHATARSGTRASVARNLRRLI